MPEVRPLTRREAIQRILAASAVAASLDLPLWGADAGTADAPGLGFDPDLLQKEIPWPRVLTAAEKRVVTALSDLIIPADRHGPAASEVGVPDFIDEWVSAPYETQRAELSIVRDGLAWLDRTAQQSHGRGFAGCTVAQQTAIVDDILRPGSEAHRAAHAFFVVFRSRTAGGYYTTREGWQAIGYVGNVALASFEGAPRTAREKLGLP